MTISFRVLAKLVAPIFTNGICLTRAQLSTVKMATDGNNPDYKKATTMHEFTVKNIKGEEVKLDVYKGHVCIVVNVASQCGLRILAFPCNQFAGQEPGNSEELVCFAADRKVKFDLFEKVDVNGDSASPLWKYLKHKQGGTLGNFVKWNFTKFIVDKNGVPVELVAKSFSMSTRRATRVPEPSPTRTRPSRSPARNRKVSPARKSPPVPKPKSPARKSPSRKLISKYPARKSPARTVKETIEPIEPEPQAVIPRSPAKRPALQKDSTVRLESISSSIYRGTRSKRIEYSVKDVFSQTGASPSKNGVTEVFGLRNRNSVEDASYTPRRSSRLREFVDVVPSLPDIRRSVSKSVSKHSRTPTKSVSKSHDTYSDEENSVVENNRGQWQPTQLTRKLSTPLRTSVSNITLIARQWEFGGLVGTAALMLLIPLSVISLLTSCMKTCSIHTLLNFTPFKSLTLWFSMPTSGLIMAQILIQAVMGVVPYLGTKTDGMDDTGKKYCFNAFMSSIIVVNLVYQLDYWQFIDKYMILNEYLKLATASYIFAVILSVAVYLKSRKLDKEELNPYGNTGYLLYDFFLGREIHPCIKNLDIKIWISRICNINTIEWTGTEDISLANIVFLIGKVQFQISNPTVLVFSMMQTVYMLYFIVREYRVTSTFYWQSEGVGYLQIVACAFYPFFFTTLSKHIAVTGLTLSTIELVICSLLYLLGFCLMLVSNDIKHEFRRDPLQPSLAKLESMITFNGKRLITSHVWGILRHPNYAGDILIHTVLALPGLLNGQIIAASPALITIL
ncbi:Glutathione peroxidase, partial [Operophtera brumata]